MEVYVDYFGIVVNYEEWWFFDYVVVDVDDQVGCFYCVMYEVVGGQCGVVEEVWVMFVDYVFVYLGGDEGNVGFVDQLFEDFGGYFVVGFGVDYQDWVVCGVQFFYCGVDCFVFCQWLVVQVWWDGQVVGLFGGDVFWQFQVYCVGFFFFGQVECFVDL